MLASPSSPGIKRSRLTTKIDWTVVKKKKGEVTKWMKMQQSTTKVEQITLQLNNVDIVVKQGPFKYNQESVHVSSSLQPVTEDILVKNKRYYVIRARMIPMNVNIYQEQLLNKMLSDARETFNAVRILPEYSAVVDAMQKKVVVGKPSIPKHRAVSKQLVNNTSAFVQANPHLKQTLTNVRDNSVKDALARLKTDVTKRMRVPSHRFQHDPVQRYSTVRFHQSWDLSIDLTNPPHVVNVVSSRDSKLQGLPKLGPLRLTERFPFPDDVIGKSVTNNGKALPPSYKHELSIHLDHCREEWQLMVPYHVPVCDEYANILKKLTAAKLSNNPIQVNVSRVIGLDPGLRSFLVGYTGDGRVIEIGNNFQSVLRQQLQKIDELRSSPKSQSKKKKKKKKLHIVIENRKQRADALSLHVINLVKDFHVQTANYLMSNFDVVFLPSFDTSQMVHRQGILHRISRRIMNAMSFYKFKQWMLYTSTKQKKLLFITTEEYTTRACGKCNTVGPPLKGDRMFHCSICQFKIGRDANGALNNLRKNLFEK